ncbi:MAG: histidinol-phosphatase [Planctomycetota bacterium]
MRRVGAGLIALVLSIALAQAADPRQELAFPDLPGYETLICDFHTHTVFSDGAVWPTVRVDEAWREGLDVLAISDHVEYQPHKADVPTNHNRSFELAAERAAQHGLLLIRAAEITRDTPPGHHNAILLADVPPLEQEDFYAVFDAAQRQQAFCFWNHPGWQGAERGQWGEWQQKLLDRKQLHGVEICNGASYYEYAHRLAVERGLTLIGNSDIHEPSRGLREFKGGHRTLTLVFAAARTQDALREALLAGRTAVWFTEQLIGREAELRALAIASLRLHPVHHRDGQRAWLRIENGCEVDLTLARVGKAGPGEIRLPARATTLVRLEGKPETLAGALPYRVTNVLVGPGQPLEIGLNFETGAVSRATQPASAPAEGKQ